MCYYPVNSSNSDILNKNSNNQVQAQWVEFMNSYLHVDRSFTNFLPCAQTVKSRRLMPRNVMSLYIFCQRNSGMKNTHSYSWQRNVTHIDLELNIDVTAAVIRDTRTHEKAFVHGKKEVIQKSKFLLPLNVEAAGGLEATAVTRHTFKYDSFVSDCFTFYPTPSKLHWYHHIYGNYSNFQRQIRRISLFLHNYNNTAVPRLLRGYVLKPPLQ